MEKNGKKEVTICGENEEGKDEYRRKRENDDEGEEIYKSQKKINDRVNLGGMEEDM